MKKKVKVVLRRSKNLEVHEPVSVKELDKIQKRTKKTLKNLKKLLKPSWFMSGLGVISLKKKTKK